MAVGARIRHSASHVLAADFHYIQGLVDRNYVGQGPLCDELRALLKAQFCCSDVILTDSGTAALHLCLLALAAAHPGRSRVLVGAYVCPEVISAIMRAGLQPVLADSRRDSLNVDMSEIGRLVDATTLAVVCTHVGGMPDDCAAAAACGVPVISDCAQAVGSRSGGRDLASEGLCAILSFGPTKMLSAGGGGAVLCRSAPLAATIGRLARPELSVEEYRRSGFQVTYGQHMGDLTAGLAAAQVRRLAALVERRRLIAASYDRELRPHGDVALVNEGDAQQANRYRYYFLSPRAAPWIEWLRSAGIDARGSISHVIPEYSGSIRAFPKLGAVARMVVSVPIFPAMTDDEIDTVVTALRRGSGG
jgi:perosamine synthetase